MMHMQDKATTDFDELLDASAKLHGHLCAGQVLGVRMSLVGLRMVGIRDPKGADRRNIMVFVEMDRCATDAVQSVTGCSLGKRSLKFLDYGKMAATFLNLRTGKAVRVAVLEESRGKARERCPEQENAYAAQVEAYQTLPENELFRVSAVAVKVAPQDMPGRPIRRVRCESCGEHIQDMREVVKDGKALCISCAEGSYYVSAGDCL